jgi:hypothetical protein
MLFNICDLPQNSLYIAEFVYFSKNEIKHATSVFGSHFITPNAFLLVERNTKMEEGQETLEWKIVCTDIWPPEQSGSVIIYLCSV